MATSLLTSNPEWNLSPLTAGGALSAWRYNGGGVKQVYLSLGPTGFLGIGTSTPSKTLDVVGDINFSGTLYQNGSIFKTSQWIQAGDNTLYYTSANVGLGTTAATSARLHIDQGATNNLAFKLTSSGPGWGSGFQLVNSTASTGRTWGQYVGSDGIFRAAVDCTAGADRINVDSGGTVYVFNNLQVSSGNIRLGNDGSTYDALQFVSTSSGHFPNIRCSTNYIGLYTTDAAGWSDHSAVGDMVVRVASGRSLIFSSDATEKMRIHSNGNVGIGTYAPECTFQVTGIVNINGGTNTAAQSGYLQTGSLSLGDTTRNYGGGSNWTSNTAALLLECLDATEIAVHDAGNRVASFMYYNNNVFTMGRDMYWGTSDFSFAANITVGSDIVLSRGSRPSVYCNGTNNDLQIRSNGTGTLQLNQDTGGPVKIGGGGGYCAIGNVTPVTPLHVYNSSSHLALFQHSGSSAAYVTIKSDNTSNYGGLCLTNGGESGLWMWKNGASRSDDGGASTATLRNDGGALRLMSAASSVSLWTNNAARLTVDSNGNVTMFGHSNNNYGINMPAGGCGIHWGAGYSRIYDDGDLRICTDDNMHFYTGSSTSAPGTEFMNYSVNQGVNIKVNTCISRSALTFSNSAGDFNHCIFNDSNNLAGWGAWDGMRMNVYAGLEVRTSSYTNNRITFAMYDTHWIYSYGPHQFHDWVRPVGDCGLYFQTYGHGLRAPQSQGASYGNVATHGTGRNGWYGYSIDCWYQFMSNWDNWGIHNQIDGQWMIYGDRNYVGLRYANSTKMETWSNGARTYGRHHSDEFWCYGSSWIQGTLYLTNDLYSGQAYTYGWFRNYGRQGLYNQDYGNHWYSNDGYYGSWKMHGNEVGGWGGIHVTGNGGDQTIMANCGATNGGIHYNGWGWAVHWDSSRNFYCAGDITAFWSDRRLKENFQAIPQVKEKLFGLTGYFFNWNEKGKKIMGPRDYDVEIGLVAQDVQAVLPQAVKVNKAGLTAELKAQPDAEEYLTIQYDKIVVLLVEAYKSLFKEVEELRALVKKDPISDS